MRWTECGLYQTVLNTSFAKAVIIARESSVAFYCAAVREAF
jgi:hypothetical protein